MSNPTKNGRTSVVIPFALVERMSDMKCFFFLSFCFLPLLTAECTPEEAFSIVGDNIIFASGSPFNDVDLGTYLWFIGLNLTYDYSSNL